MGSIGQTLRQTREQRGVSIADVQGATKITSQNLVALEEDRLDAFPNRVYARAFLRDYANYLGLDSAPLLDQYELGWSPQAPEVKPQPAAKSSDGAGALVRSFAILVILVVVGLAVWRPVARAIQGMTHPSVAHVDDAAPAPPTTKAETKPVPPPVASANPKPTTPVVAPTPAPQGANLVVDTLTQSWIRVIVDGQPAFEGILPAFTQKSWHGSRVILFRTGNAGGVRLTFNGKKLPQIGPSGHIGKCKFVAPPPPAMPAITTGQPPAHKP